MNNRIDEMEIDDSNLFVDRHSYQANRNYKEPEFIKQAKENHTYINGTPFELDRADFDNSIYEWLSNIAAADLISTKNIDALIYENSKLDKDASFEFDELLKKNNLEIKIYDLAKRASINGIAGIWFQPRILEMIHNKYSLNTKADIIQYKVVNNEPQSIKFIVPLVSGISIGNVYALITADKYKYRTSYYAMSNEEYSKIKKDDWNKTEQIAKYEYHLDEIQEQLESFGYNEQFIQMMNQEHNLGFLPFFILFFNEDNKAIINKTLLQPDMNELFSIAQKIYDEANMMGTKIKWLNDGDIDSNRSREDLAIMMKIMGSLAGLYAKNDFNNDQQNADVDLIAKAPLYQSLMDAFKTKLNFMLKKIGLSSDTDSKGTVQQSVGEIIKQNEFSYNNQNYRNLVLQNYLQNLLQCFYEANYRVPDQELKKKVKVLSTQSLGMSEMEKLQYVIQAKSNGLIDTARGISILTGKNYMDALVLMDLQELKESPVQPDLMKNHNLGSNND